jgi:hypothetical protein
LWHFSSNCGSYSHYPQQWCLLLLLHLQLWVLEDVPGYLCYVSSHGSAHGCDGTSPQHCSPQPGQQDEPLLDFLVVPVYPPVPNHYASLTPAELAAFGIIPSHAPAGSDDDDGEEANDDEEMEDNE